MQYMLLIYTDDNQAMSPEEQKAEYEAYWKFTSDLKESGAMVAGDALQPISTATTVRLRGGKVATTDGPFAETKEQLGGYYLIEVDDLDQAIQWAARIPSSSRGSIEVRPVMVFES